MCYYSIPFISSNSSNNFSGLIQVDDSVWTDLAYYNFQVLLSQWSNAIVFSPVRLWYLFVIRAFFSPLQFFSFQFAFCRYIYWSKIFMQFLMLLYNSPVLISILISLFCLFCSQHIRSIICNNVFVSVMLSCRNDIYNLIYRNCDSFDLLPFHVS